MILPALLIVFAVLAALASLGILFTRNVLHAALLLIVTLVSLAGIYLLLQAEFLAVTQILVYAGGVLVLILFGIMLSPHFAIKVAEPNNPNRGLALLVTTGLLISVGYPLSQLTPVGEPHSMKTHLADIGASLFSNYVVPFELAGVLLLISLVSAILICAQVLASKSP